MKQEHNLGTQLLQHNERQALPTATVKKSVHTINNNIATKNDTLSAQQRNKRPNQRRIPRSVFTLATATVALLTDRQYVAVETQQTHVDIKTELLARNLPLDMNLDSEQDSFIKRKFRFFRKPKSIKQFGLRTMATLLLFVVLAGGALGARDYINLHKAFHGNAAPVADVKTTSSNKNLLNGESTGRINVLVMGRDGQVDTSKNPDITDTLMLASIDVVNRNVTLVSIPSDLWVNVPGAGVMKLSAAFQSGEFNYEGQDKTSSTDPKAVNAGFNLVDQSVDQVLGVNINYNTIINLSGLTSLVNSLGGISVNVPSDLVDPTMAWQNGGNATLVSSGTQTLNGHQATLYAMSKETTSDFSRATRQRQILQALFTKITAASTLTNPIKLSDMINTLGANISSDLSLSNAGSLYQILNGISAQSVTSLDLNTAPNTLVTTGNVNGQAVILPSSGLFNYGAIKSFIGLQLKNPYLTKENAKIMILNGTSTAGLATTLSGKLTPKGFNVIGEANAPTSNYTSGEIIEINKSDTNTAKLLQANLHLKLITKLPNKTIPTDGADFVIILGSNEANSNQN